MSFHAPEIPATSCLQFLSPEMTGKAEPVAATTADPSNAEERPRAASVALLTPPDSPTLNNASQLTHCEDENTSNTQDVCYAPPNSPATLFSTLNAPVTLTIQVKPHQSPDSPANSQSSGSPRSCLTFASTQSWTSSHSISAEEIESARAELMEEWNTQTGSAPLDRRLPLPPAVPNLFQFHDENMSTALKALNEKGIPVVEYGQQIQFRWGWVEILVVSDEPGPLITKLI